MRYLVKVRVNPALLADFGRKLQKGELDRSMIRSETYCLRADPAVGYSVWEADSKEDFERIFSAWRVHYSEFEVTEVVSANEAMLLLMKK